MLANVKEIVYNSSYIMLRERGHYETMRTIFFTPR